MAKSGTSWRPGQSGNPSGRPRNELLTLLREAANEVDGGVTKGEKLVIKIWEMALAGDIRAISILFDRLFGRVREAMDFIDDPENQNIEVRITGLDENIFKNSPGKNVNDDII